MNDFQVINEPSVIDPIIWADFYPENPDIYGLKDLMSYYSCYNYNIIRSPKGLIAIRVKATLEIFTKRDVLLVAQISRDFHILTPDNYTIKDMIIHFMGRTHNEFIYLFETKSVTNPLMAAFRPAFDEVLANHLASRVLHPNAENFPHIQS